MSTVPRGRRTLYLCYLGLREPLVQSQVLPYLRALVEGGTETHLLTFERHRGEALEADLLRANLERDGIRWHRLRYHKRPSLPATLFDIAAGAAYSLGLVRRYGIQVLHARAHVALAMALPVRSLAGCRVIFDVRGLVADEYADAGIWRKDSAVFRTVKRLERAGLAGADQVIVLTERMREWITRERLTPPGRIEVIPCCVDTARFRFPAERGGRDRRDLVYAGSVTGLYLLDEMADFFRAYDAVRPGGQFRVLTTFDPVATATRLRARGLLVSQFAVKAVAPEQLPAELDTASAGISLRRSGFAQIAASPTKVPEYLAAGLPVVSNAGIGDCDELLQQHRVGVVLRDFTPDAHREAARALVCLLEDPGVQGRCRTAAVERFDLRGVGAPRYRDVYARLAARARRS